MIIRPRRARPDTYTSLLIKAFGANGSTTFKDFSQSGHTISVYGNTQISSVQAKFPPVSIFFDGNGDYFTVPDNDVLDFGTDDFTVEAFIKYTTYANHASIITKGFHPNPGEWIFKLDANNGYLTFGGHNGTVITGTTNVGDNVWHHVAVTRAGGTVRTFIDGVVDQTSSIWDGVSFTNTIAVHIGVVLSGSDPDWWGNGYMDCARISKGIARWVANFTPPTRRY